MILIELEQSDLTNLKMGLNNTRLLSPEKDDGQNLSSREEGIDLHQLGLEQMFELHLDR